MLDSTSFTLHVPTIKSHIYKFNICAHLRHFFQLNIHLKMFMNKSKKPIPLNTLRQSPPEALDISK